METTQRITYHVQLGTLGRTHDFYRREEAIAFARALSHFGPVGASTFVHEIKRRDDGCPITVPNTIWSKVRS